LVFPDFLEICREHIQQTNSAEFEDFENFEANCLHNDGLAILEFLIDLKRKGCTVDLGDSDDSKDDSNGHRRFLQFLDQMFATTETCSWDDLNDLASQVDSVCCADFTLSSDSTDGQSGNDEIKNIASSATAELSLDACVAECAEQGMGNYDASSWEWQDGFIMMTGNQTPSCAAGCAFSEYAPDLATCQGWCNEADRPDEGWGSGGCEFTIPNSEHSLQMCGACPNNQCPQPGECNFGCNLKTFSAGATSSSVQACSSSPEAGHYFGTPSTCSTSCAMAMHEFTGRCGDVMQSIFGADRMGELVSFGQQCITETEENGVDLLNALKTAVCPADADLGGGDETPDACQSLPCQNDAVCTPQPHEYTCSCYLGCVANTYHPRIHT
jgi:hypothetical protein